MNLLNKIFRSDIKKQYLAGWEVYLDGKEHCQDFIQTQLTDKETAKNLYTYIELSFDTKDLLNSVSLFNNGQKEKSGFLFENLASEDAIGKLAYRNLDNNNILEFVEVKMDHTFRVVTLQKTSLSLQMIVQAQFSTSERYQNRITKWPVYHLILI